MSYRVVLTPLARQMLVAVRDRRERDTILLRIDELAANPEQLGKPMRGNLQGLRDLRAVGQRYRILYRVEPAQVVVLVLAVGRRRAGSPDDVYALAERLADRGQLGDP